MPAGTTELPEGEIRFEIGEMEQEFSFQDPAAEPENFTQAQEEKNLSGPSLRSSVTSTVPEKSERQELPDGRGKPSVRAELDQIKREKQEAGRKNAQRKNRGRNRPAGRKKIKRKAKGR